MLWAQTAPRLFPDLFRVPQRPNQEAIEREQAAGKFKPDALLPRGTGEPNPEPEFDLPNFPSQTVMLGSGGFREGYLLQAQLTTKGAAVEWVQLTDERYKTLDRKAQLKVVGNVERLENGNRIPRTFEMSVPQIDQVLNDLETSLAEVDWELVEQTENTALFRFPSPRGDMEVLKQYRLDKGVPEKRDASPDGYLLRVEITLRNLSDEALDAAYTLQGPVGLPLENVENTRSFREIDIATLSDLQNPQRISSLHLTAADLIKQHEKAKKGGKPIVSWREPIHYAGLDVQFFTALLLPDRTVQAEPDPMFEVVQPQVLIANAAHPEWSDFSITLDSLPQLLAPQEEKVHAINAFFGPKRTQLLEPLYAGDVVRLGWFSWIAKSMLFVLDFFHSVVGLPYAYAIILLTVVVRGAMFPISKKQAIEAEKMRVLAPKLKEIQEKHREHPEEFAKAYRAFQKKYNYHPMVGCLPALLQLPIFWGLYTSLYQAIDLRLSRFLWIENLAAPDALFQLGFVVPWFEYTEFNLLPILTVALFIVQQKLFTPPPTSDEQAMTYKMMNIMMIVIGFAFYRVPAGLCLYFISSSLWGIGERLLLKKQVKPDGTLVEQTESSDDSPGTGGGGKRNEPKPPQPNKPPGFLERLRQAADEAQAAAHGSGEGRKYSKPKKR